jgi:hypothetical protein
MTKLLNLDELPTRTDHTIVLKGKSHHMVPLSVGQFIAQQKAAKKIDATAEQAPDETIATLIGMIAEVFPTIPKPQLEALTFPQLNAIFEFVGATGEAPEGAVAGE